MHFLLSSAAEGGKGKMMKKSVMKLCMAAAATAAVLSLSACGGKTTDTEQREAKETEKSGVSELAAALQGKEDEDPMKGDNQAVIEIGTAEELSEFRDRVNAGEQAIDAVLTADIDLSSVCGEGIGNWVPIASEDGHFGGSYNGVFDGAGHVIRGLYMEGEGADYAALFLKLGYTGIIKDLGIEDAFLDSNDQAAVLVLENEGIIENCYASETSVKGRDAYGLIGTCTEESVVKNCYNRGTVQGENHACGVVGDCYGGEISGCYNEGEVLAEGKQGRAYGVALGISDGTITDCYNTGTVTAVFEATGVIGGVQSDAVMTGCYNTGTVTSDGIASGVSNGVVEAVMDRCYNTGTITGENMAVGVARAEGDMKKKSVAVNCFNRGSVSAVSNAMGIDLGMNCVTINCYNLGTVSSQNNGMSGAAGIAGTAVTYGECEQRMYNCYSAGALSENAGGLSYWKDMAEMESVFYQEDTAVGYYFSRKGGEQDTTHSVSKEALTGGEVLEKLNAFAESFSGLPEDCAEKYGLTLDSWKAGPDGYPVFEWEN